MVFRARTRSSTSVAPALEDQIKDSHLFDLDYYTKQRSDVPGHLEQAWSHYREFGWMEGLNPSQYFDVSFYLDSNPDVAEAGCEPLRHWYTQGRYEGRFPFNPFRAEVLKPERDSQRLGSPENGIAICIPIFNAFDAVSACVRSVLETIADEDVDVVVHLHDDGSLVPLSLKQLQCTQSSELKLTRSSSNKGFTKTANYLIASNPGRDIVLLNSDTVVFPGWLSGLKAAAYSSSQVGSVSAISNNATIVSYPNWPSGSRISTFMAKRLARAFSNASLLGVDGLHLLPTAVGSCMYMRRDAIEEVGTFDERKFPRGYGEENDWSLRAQLAGWVNIVAPNVYVFHEGGVSFGDEARRQRDAGSKTLLEDYPDYDLGISQWVQSSSLPVLFRNSHVARSMIPMNLAAVHITHSLGGGTQEMVCRMALDESRKTGFPTLVIRCERGIGHGFLIDSVAEDLSEDAFVQFNLVDLVDILKTRIIADGSITIHDHNQISSHQIQELRSLGFSPILRLHDVRSICPRGFMVLVNGESCSGPTIPKCDRCCSLDGGGKEGLAVHLTAQKAQIRLYDAIAAPSTSAASLLSTHLGVAVEVFGAQSERNTKPSRSTCPQDDSGTNNRLRVLIVGHLAPHKGALFIRNLADLAYVENPLISFYHAGSWQAPFDPPRSMIQLGTYVGPEGIRKMSEEYDFDAFLIPSPAAETYSLTLDDILAARRTDQWVITPDGPLWTERLNTVRNVHTISLEDGLHHIARSLVQLPSWPAS